MPSLVLCYAAGDEAAARELARFLEANVDYQVSLDECRVRSDFDLIDAAERALSADAALVLLSPASVPKVWKRERWEPVFFGNAEEFATPLGFALLAECKFPELLRRRAFFDLSKDLRQGLREVKRWLMKGDVAAARTAAFPELRAAIGDWPGVAVEVAPDIARGFAAACAGDFESVHRIACHGRSAAGILGDIGQAIGARLPGNVEQNRAALVSDCAAHRRLFVLEWLAPAHRDMVNFGGRSSTILTADVGEPERVSQEAIGGAFLVSARDEAECAPLIGAATLWTYDLFQSDFDNGLRLGWALLTVLKSAGRFAESVEVLASMEQAARARNDDMALFKIEWEQSWTCEDSDAWGVRILPTAGEEVTQLSLFEQLA
jgi:hypothetical protein